MLNILGGSTVLTYLLFQIEFPHFTASGKNSQSADTNCYPQESANRKIRSLQSNHNI